MSDQNKKYFDEEFEKGNFKFPVHLAQNDPIKEELYRMVFGSGAVNILHAIGTRLKRLAAEGKIGPDAGHYLLHEISDLGEQVQVETVGKIAVSLENTKLKHAKI